MCQFVPKHSERRGLSRRWSARAAALLGIALLSLPAAPRPAHACGGLFCSGGGGSSTTTTQGGIVNQTAERIVFVENDDATISAVIQILYEGPSEKFAWIIPVSGVPDVAVSSGVVLDALQQQTNPNYQISITRNCPQSFPSGGGSFGGDCTCGCAAAAPTSAGQGPISSLLQMGGPVVTVEAAGAIGPYDYTVISVQPFAFDPAQVALQWLTDNGFDAGTTAADALRPYLQDGLNLLAFRLHKDTDVGSIRPVMITYAGKSPSIPIGPTAVAADDDMGVLVWVAAKARAVPINYKTVVLDEARINWLNPGENYDAVVGAAADEAGGQAFVTESASPLSMLQSDPAFMTLKNDAASYQQAAYTDWLQALVGAWRWQSWDGFDDALSAAATLPAGLTFASFRACLPPAAAQSDAAATSSTLQDCLEQASAGSASGVSVDVAMFRQKLDELVISPVVDTIDKIDAQPYLTRLYTKLSPEEMTLDPVFDVNPDAEAVSNAHIAQGTVPCSGTLATVPLPQGASVGVETNSMTWPVAADAAPAALQVLQYGVSGPPLVLDDQRGSLMGAKFGLAACGPYGPGGSGGLSTVPGSAAGGGAAGGAAMQAAGGGAGSGAGEARASVGGDAGSPHGGGCSALAARASGPGWLLPWALCGLALWRNRRRPAPRRWRACTRAPRTPTRPTAPRQRVLWAEHDACRSRSDRKLPVLGVGAARWRDRVVVHAALRFASRCSPRLLDEREGGSFVIGPADAPAARSATCPTPTCSRRASRPPTASFRVLDFAPRFVQHGRSFRPDEARAHRRAARRARRALRVPCDPLLGWSRAQPAPRARLAPHRATAATTPSCASRPTCRSPTWTAEPFALTGAQALRAGLGRAGRGAARAAVRALPARDRPLLAALGEALRHPAALPGGGDPLGARAQAALLRGHRRDRRGARPPRSPKRPAAAAPGTTATAGCATRTTRSAPFACSGTSRSASSFCTSCSTSRRPRPISTWRRSIASTARTDLDERIARRLARLRGREPGARRQRGGRAPPARRLRRDGAGADARCSSTRASASRSRRPLLDLVERLARKAVAVAGTARRRHLGVPLRAGSPQTFCALMCWAAADRMAASPSATGPATQRSYAAAAEHDPRASCCAQALDPARGCLVADYGGSEVDASLLQAVDAARPAARTTRACTATVDAVWRRPRNIDGWLQRYRTDDGFGAPTVAFTLCTFWLVEALAALGAATRRAR